MFKKCGRHTFRDIFIHLNNNTEGQLASLDYFVRLTFTFLHNRKFARTKMFHKKIKSRDEENS